MRACQAAQLSDAGGRLAALELDLEQRQQRVAEAEAAAATHSAREEVHAFGTILKMILSSLALDAAH